MSVREQAYYLLVQYPDTTQLYYNDYIQSGGYSNLVKLYSTELIFHPRLNVHLPVIQQFKLSVIQQDMIMRNSSAFGYLDIIKWLIMKYRTRIDRDYVLSAIRNRRLSVLIYFHSLGYQFTQADLTFAFQIWSDRIIDLILKSQPILSFEFRKEIIHYSNLNHSVWVIKRLPIYQM